jgi:hypothetical protein
VVEGALVPGTDFDRLSVVALQGGTSTPLALATLEGAELRLPATFNFESGPATPAGTRISVRATAERAGVVRSTAAGETTLAEKGGASLTLTLPPIPPPTRAPPTGPCGTSSRRRRRRTPGSPRRSTGSSRSCSTTPSAVAPGSTTRSTRAGSAP